MKKIKATIFYVITIALLSSCGNGNQKLEQANAEKAIKGFVESNSFTGSGSWGQQGSFNVNSITSIEPVSQFSDAEASSIVHFNYHDAFSNGALTLKFNFKKNMDKHWIMTSVNAVSGIGSENMGNKIRQWQNTSVMAQ
ncbi:MAG TPA: hypothetical protein VKH37_03900 [Ferruginibacter sp.]|nr:hypothetical protein [Ferruginibacter sp.]